MSIEKAKQPVRKLPASVVRLAKAPGEKYYDWHPTREDLMGESVPQSDLIDYLRDVLTWLYHREDWFVASNLNVYLLAEAYKEYPITPDVALFKNIVVPEADRASLRSWKMYEPNRPTPTVVFEISSKDTWRDDLTTKPAAYQRMGVSEYFAYDPNQPPYWKVNRKWVGIRLRGWQYKDGQMTELEAEPNGWIWSEQLAHWVVPAGRWLRLYDHNKKIALTRAEAAEQQADQERTAKERAWAILREHGIDPEKL